MSEITYSQFEKELSAAGKTGRFAPVYLIFGDPCLCRLAYAKLLDAMVPEAKRSLNYEVFEGPDEDIPAAIESLNTYSFFGGGKVVGVKDSSVFVTGEDNQKALEKAREEVSRKQFSRAAGPFLRVLKRMELSAEDVLKPDIREELKLSDDDDMEWLAELADYCLKNKSGVPESRDHARILEQAIRKEFPSGNRLLISTEKVDRRKGLFKAILELGVAVDCSIPDSPRQADRKVRDAIVSEFVGFHMKPSGKTLRKEACDALLDATGPDLGIIATSLDKLIDYAGERSVITVEDVASVLIRTREDPVFKLTGAIGARNLSEALSVLASLLEQKLVPQQIISGIARHMRKLLVAKDFVKSPRGRAWRPRMPFPVFKTQVLPAILEHDAELKAFIENARAVMEPPAQTDGDEKAKPRKKGGKTDLLLVENPGNPFPVYSSISESDNYAMEELVRAFMVLSDTEWELRSPPRHHRTILERMIIRICAKAEA